MHWVCLSAGERQALEWADRAIAALYRGADLSTISKGDSTGASLQGDESGMIEQDAAENLGETLHEQVDRFVIRNVTGDDEPLAHIVIEPVTKPDIDTDIKIDTHLVSMGCRLSKADMMQRYGRTEATSDDDVAEQRQNAQPGLGGFGGLANERQPEKVKVKGEGEQRNSSSTVHLDPSPSPILAAFAKDMSPAGKAVEELLKNPSKEAAEALLAKLDTLLPEDPATAAVIAEAMAKEFTGATGVPPVGADKTELENEVQRVPSGNGNGGQFTGKTNQPRGKEPETKPQHDRYGSTDTDKLTSDPKKNAERGAATIEEVMRKKSGYVDNAMFRPEVGWIRFEWGDAGNPAPDEKGVTYKGGHGLSHIDAKAGHDVKDLPTVLSQGEIFKHENPDRLYVLHGTKYAVLRKLGKGRKVAITEFHSGHDPKKIEFIKNQPRAAKPGEN